MIINEADSVLFDMLSESSSRTFFFFGDLKEDTARWSKGAVEYFGLESELLHPALELWSSRIYPEDLEKYLSDFDEMVKRQDVNHDCEYRIKNAEGEYVWVNCKGIVRYDEENRPVLFAGFVTNMGTRNKIDPVTNLFTVFEFRNDIDAELQRGHCGAALNLSINNFKRINDLYSYSFGDKVLKEAGRMLMNLVGAESKVYRLEGSDFGIIYPNATKEDVDKLYAKIQKKLSDFWVEEKEISIALRSSCILYPDHGKFLDPLQTHLSYALAKAKTDKADMLVYFSDEIHAEQAKREHLQEELTKSLQVGCYGFRIVYQPILNEDGSEIRAVEALLRWKNDDFPKIGPMEFVPILEETGMIQQVGKWILSECIRNIGSWKKLYGKAVKTHVNMSLIQFMDEDILTYIQRELSKYDVDPQMLVLELTESCRVEYTEELGKELQKFKNVGIEIALDDFGTGYASMAVLKDIPADVVKLDHTMIRSILNSPKDRALIEFFISYSQKVDIIVCAEGVENKEILDIVRKAGASLLQGYYFDRPMEEDDFCRKYLL